MECNHKNGHSYIKKDCPSCYSKESEYELIAFKIWKSFYKQRTDEFKIQMNLLLQDRVQNSHLKNKTKLQDKEQQSKIKDAQNYFTQINAEQQNQIIWILKNHPSIASEILALENKQSKNQRYKINMSYIQNDRIKFQYKNHKHNYEFDQFSIQKKQTEEKIRIQQQIKPFLK